MLGIVGHNRQATFRRHEEVQRLGVGKERPLHWSIFKSGDVFYQEVYVLVRFLKAVAGILVQNVLEYFSGRVHDVQHSVSVDRLG